MIISEYLKVNNKDLRQKSNLMNTQIADIHLDTRNYLHNCLKK